MKKKYTIALVRYEQFLEENKKTKRNVAIYETFAVSEAQAINQVKFRVWGKEPMTDIEHESDPGHRLWDAFEVYDGGKVYGM